MPTNPIKNVTRLLMRLPHPRVISTLEEIERDDETRESRNSWRWSDDDLPALAYAIASGLAVAYRVVREANPPEEGRLDEDGIPLEDNDETEPIDYDYFRLAYRRWTYGRGRAEKANEPLPSSRLKLAVTWAGVDVRVASPKPRAPRNEVNEKTIPADLTDYRCALLVALDRQLAYEGSNEPPISRTALMNDIARWKEKPSAEPGRYNRPSAELGRRGLTVSFDGKKGGLLLTLKGQDEAKKLREATGF